MYILQINTGNQKPFTQRIIITESK
jgi:hypothetical protein